MVVTPVLVPVYFALFAGKWLVVAANPCALGGVNRAAALSLIWALMVPSGLPDANNTRQEGTNRPVSVGGLWWLLIPVDQGGESGCSSLCAACGVSCPLGGVLHPRFLL